MLPVNLQLSVLYEDDTCLVIDKPAGLVVCPGAGVDPETPTLLSGVAYLFQEKGISFDPDHTLVHRLDKDTTGCVLVAKSLEAHSALQKQFADRTVQKEYLALVAGVPVHPEAVIDAPIGRNLLRRLKMSVTGVRKTKPAKTSYVMEAVGADRGVALLRCTLHTGRTHQARVHLSSIGYPVLGDTTYANAYSREQSAKFGADSICLHAVKLCFHSSVGGDVCVESEVPEEFGGVMERAGVGCE